MEERMLRALKFDIGVPLSYRFLRRYARVSSVITEEFHAFPTTILIGKSV